MQEKNMNILDTSAACLEALEVLMKNEYYLFEKYKQSSYTFPWKIFRTNKIHFATSKKKNLFLLKILINLSCSFAIKNNSITYNYICSW